MLKVIMAIGCLLTSLVSTEVVGAPLCTKTRITKNCVSVPPEAAKPAQPEENAAKCAVPGRWACSDGGNPAAIILAIDPNFTGLSTGEDCPPQKVQITSTGPDKFREVETVITPSGDCVGSSSQNTFSGDCKSFSGPWINDGGNTGTWSCQRVQ
jgi:hypothetical protein